MTNKTYLTRHVADKFVGKSIRPRQCQELVPVSGDNICNVEPRHECDWDDFGESGKVEGLATQLAIIKRL